MCKLSFNLNKVWMKNANKFQTRFTSNGVWLTVWVFDYETISVQKRFTPFIRQESWKTKAFFSKQILSNKKVRGNNIKMKKIPLNNVG